MLAEVHQCFSARDLLFVELVPRFGAAQAVLADAGRARKRQRTPAAKPLATIACVSGFLITMPRQQISLITPCAPSERWPDGYQTIASAIFEDADHLDALLGLFISTHMAAPNAKPPSAPPCHSGGGAEGV
jgi:hypothetical protein